MQISVIIPVYNAAAYVTQAVESALAQPETAEVLLVEDGSPDGALSICRELATQYPKVRLLQHPQGENRGAGASRNLGMREAKSAWIAFLDADDYYLPGRFSADSRVITAHPECEGVYSAVEMHVEDLQARTRWDEAGKPPDRIQTLKADILPADLAEALLEGSVGYFHIDAFSIKKTVLDRSGMMCEDLRLHQDTEFILRVAMCALLLPASRTEQVASWRVHAQNRISAPRSKVRQLDDRLRMWEVLNHWCRANDKLRFRAKIMSEMVVNVMNQARFGGQSIGRVQRRVLRLWNLTKWLIRKPRYWADGVFWKAFFQQASLVSKPAGELTKTGKEQG